MHADTDGRLDYAPGDRLGFDLLLLGEAVSAQAPVVLAMRRMAAAGLGRGRQRFRLDEVASEDAAGRFHPGYGGRLADRNLIRVPIERWSGDARPSPARPPLYRRRWSG